MSVRAVAAALAFALRTFFHSDARGHPGIESITRQRSRLLVVEVDGCFEQDRRQHPTGFRSARRPTASGSGLTTKGSWAWGR